MSRSKSPEKDRIALQKLRLSPSKKLSSNSNEVSVQDYNEYDHQNGDNDSNNNDSNGNKYIKISVDSERESKTKENKASTKEAFKSIEINKEKKPTYKLSDIIYKPETNVKKKLSQKST